MLITKSEHEKQIHKKRSELLHDLINSIQKFHLEYDLKQKKLEKEFNFNQLDEIVINIDDDFTEDDNTDTKMCVEHYGIPDKVCFDILLEVKEYIERNELLPEDCSMRFNFYDSASIYPTLALEHSYSMFKKWEIVLENINHEIIDELLNDLKYFKTYKEVKVEFISES